MFVLVVVFSYKGCVSVKCWELGECVLLILLIIIGGMHSYKERVYSYEMIYEVCVMNFKATSDHTRLIQK